MNNLIKEINKLKKEGCDYLLSFACGWMKAQVESDEKNASSKVFTSKDVLKLLEALRENNA